MKVVTVSIVKLRKNYLCIFHLSILFYIVGYCRNLFLYLSMMSTGSIFIITPSIILRYQEYQMEREILIKLERNIKLELPTSKGVLNVLINLREN